MHSKDHKENKSPFVRDVEAIRNRARAHLEQGAITPGYKGDLDTAVRLLNEAVATELVCVLRYKFHATMAIGLASESVKKEFAMHADEEAEHMDWLCERINQLGGKPNLSPEGLASRAVSQYVEGTTLVEMIREDLVAERIAIDTYRDLVHYFGENDPTTRRLLERILEKEEEHANDMHDLLAAHDENFAKSEAKQGTQKQDTSKQDTKANNGGAQTEGRNDSRMRS